jgi:hypothetical protein
VGRGIHLRPYQPYALAQVLFKRDQSRVINSKETGRAEQEAYSFERVDTAVVTGYDLANYRAEPGFPSTSLVTMSRTGSSSTNRRLVGDGRRE